MDNPDYVQAARTAAAEVMGAVLDRAAARLDPDCQCGQAAFNMLVTAALHQQMVCRLDHMDDHADEPDAMMCGLRAYLMMFDCQVNVDILPIAAPV